MGNFRDGFKGKALIVLVLILALMFLPLLSVPKAQAAYYVKQIWSRFSATAGETLATGNVVALKDSDGYAYKADADVATLRPAAGIVGKGASTGGTVEIISCGILSGWSSLAEGGAAYLSTTAGAVTQTAPAFWKQSIGTAISTTNYLFNFQDFTFDSTVILTQDPNAYAAVNTTTDTTTITVPAGLMQAGTALRFTAGGTIAGGNAAKNVILYIDNAAIVTLATQAATTGDWQAEFIMAEYTDTAHQKCLGKLIIATGADVELDYATDTTDFSSAATVKLQVVSGNGSDTITQEYCLVEFIP